MTKTFKRLLPWNWFKPEGEKQKPKTHTIGGKRKRDDDPDAGAKKQRLSREALQRIQQDTNTIGTNQAAVTDGDKNYWTDDVYKECMNGSGRLHKGPNSSSTHAVTPAPVDSQDQVQDGGNTNHAHYTSSRPPQSSMPPPATPVKRTRQARTSDMNAARTSTELDTEDATVLSLAPTNTIRARFAQPEAFDLEQARRHAAAVSIPPNSGVWSLSEKQLFYHLALRGFEPLLPQNWMVDFKTLPLSLFANDNTDPPLIQVHNGTNFRAVVALRSLIETGKLVRDKSLAGPKSSAEKTIEKSIRHYFSWAFSDSSFNLSDPKCIPTHTILTRKRGQSTATAIQLLNNRLRTLASQHRKRLGLLPSIEPPSSNTTFSSPSPHIPPEAATQVYDDTFPHESPVVVGILIVSAIVVIFTLNGYNSQNDEGGTDLDSAGLRFIAKFDFSDGAYDVWNAIAVAIVVVQVREGMERVGLNNDTCVDGGEADQEEKEMDEFTPTSNSSRKGKAPTNAGWFSGEGFEDTTLVVEDDNDDDPDL